MNKQLAEMYYQRGEHYHEDERYDEAIVNFEEVLRSIRNGEIEKSFWLTGATFRFLANSYRRRGNSGDRDKALEYLNEGIDLLSE